jgi:hypothetical protein
MTNVSFFVREIDGVEMAIIDHGNGEFTSMLKSTYDEQQVEHLTEIPPQAALSTPMVTVDEAETI